jgi:hypothetical protein
MNFFGCNKKKDEASYRQEMIELFKKVSFMGFDII